MIFFALNVGNYVTKWSVKDRYNIFIIDNCSTFRARQWLITKSILTIFLMKEPTSNARLTKYMTTYGQDNSRDVFLGFFVTFTCLAWFLDDVIGLRRQKTIASKTNRTLRWGRHTTKFIPIRASVFLFLLFYNTQCLNSRQQWRLWSLSGRKVWFEWRTDVFFAVSSTQLAKAAPKRNREMREREWASFESRFWEATTTSKTMDVIPDSTCFASKPRHTYWPSQARGVSFRCGMIACIAVHVCRLFGDTMSLLCMSTEVGKFIGVWWNCPISEQIVMSQSMCGLDNSCNCCIEFTKQSNKLAPHPRTWRLPIERSPIAWKN